MARDIVQENESDTFECRHMTVSVSQDAMERIKKRINQLRSDIISIVHKDSKKADRVYKIALHDYPESLKD